MTIDEQILAAFYEIITPEKQEMYDRIALERTKHVTVALEHISKNHNASAILRTCDCFGIQDLHVMEKNKDYVIQREIARGSGNWVDLHSYSSQNPYTECYHKLKKDGYRLIATSPHATKTIYDVDLTSPIALVFGTERHGISQEAIQNADELIQIPMYGFTESFNVSVSVALLLNSIRHMLEKSDIDWRLSKEEIIRLKIDWCTKIIREGKMVEAEIRSRILEKD